jgi:sodium-dependent dicarboxylate transporter 2/3/5
VPWDIVLLMGGGFALATGLDVWLAGHLSILRNAPTWMMILAICARMTFVTEFTSNINSTTIMLPILAALAQSMEVKPLLLIVPATLSASCAFMMPVATLPNAIFFERLDRDSANGAGGFFLKCAGNSVGSAMSYAGIYFVIGIDPTVFPAWAAP